MHALSTSAPISPQRLSPGIRIPKASEDIAHLSACPRVRLGRWPTPIQTYSDRELGDILVKRDDLSGWGRGGAKARKLEHVIGYLKRQRHDELITVAGNVTNIAFDLVPALDRHGIRLTLLIQDDPPTGPRDREAIFAEIRDRVHLLGHSRVQTLRCAVGAWVRSRARGGRPFLLLPGASHPAAVIGNACGFLEMAAQRLGSGQPLPSAVFVTAATGTTLAGFLVAERALRRAGCDPIRIIGVQVYPGAVRHRTMALVRWTERYARLLGRVRAGDLEIVGSCLHGGFGQFPPELPALCDAVHDRGGPRCDPIFGGKTWSAMQQQLRESNRCDRPVLYWHCGYTPEWQMLGSAVRARQAP